MTLVDFAEKTSPLTLTEWQKQFLTAYEQAKKENKQLFFTSPRISGRQMMTQIIQEFDNFMKMKK